MFQSFHHLMLMIHLGECVVECVCVCGERRLCTWQAASWRHHTLATLTFTDERTRPQGPTHAARTAADARTTPTTLAPVAADARWRWSLATGAPHPPPTTRAAVEEHLLKCIANFILPGGDSVEMEVQTSESQVHLHAGQAAHTPTLTSTLSPTLSTSPISTTACWSMRLPWRRRIASVWFT
jgi:hypothetical protein